MKRCGGALAAALVAVSCSTLASAEAWHLELLAEPAGEVVGCGVLCTDREGWLWVASCSDKDSTCPDHVAVEFRPRVGPLESDWSRWALPPSVGVSGTEALELLASLRPMAFSLQVFQFVESLQAGSWQWRLSPTPAEFVHRESAGRYGDLGWSLDNWAFSEALAAFQYPDAVLLFYPGDASEITVSFDLCIFDDGGDSPRDDPVFGTYRVAVRCVRAPLADTQSP